MSASPFNKQTEAKKPEQDEQDAFLDKVVQHTVNTTAFHVQHHLLPGNVTGISNGRVAVSIPAISTETFYASTLSPVTEDDIGKCCVVQFLQGDLSQPIIMGLLYSPETTQQNKEIFSSHIEITENDKQVCIEAKEELVLRCGKAQIVMTADGHISIRGLYIDSQAKATQRIRGGSIQVN